MQKLLLFGMAGFIAQLVDGSLGMGYGLTSSTMLIALGISPAVASASIHFAEIATTAASGTAHYRFGNVDVALLKRMVVPGAIGAFVGALFLGSISGDLIKPFVSAFLLLLGVYVTASVLLGLRKTRENKLLSHWKTVPLSIVAGFFDSVGGGGWGPIATPTLMAHAGMEPRRVVGTVDASEFAVTLAGSLGFLLVLGLHGINWSWVAIFAVSGLIAAPIAAALVRYLPAQVLAAIVGGAIILTNARTVLGSLSVDTAVVNSLLLGGLVLWAALVAYVVRRYRRGTTLAEAAG
ncbi:sulfite exporter TauE/SafE family protein [uncultured Salinisphaera sp.]|uniref:sulfite exporter TauE/SafE family protein n=1 Tax=uncultured Salinisphaera sp. TaxID=359372 RepID=UPI0032B29A27